MFGIHRAFVLDMEQNILRIESNQNSSALPGEPLVLRLSGQLVAATLPSLEPLLESALIAGREVELDLDGVVRSDRVASEYLSRVSRIGVQLRRCPLLMRVWLRIARRTAKNKRDNYDL